MRPTEKQASSLSSKLQALLRLSRWQQHVPYTVPLVLIGALVAVYHSDNALDWRLLFVTLANILAMAFAFMVNDVVDAPDDMRDPLKAQKNVIAQGILTARESVFALILVVILSAVLFALGGGRNFLVGASTLILSYLYSVPPVRLKARPIVDIVSHVLMLSALILLSGYVLYDTRLDAVWALAFGVAFASAYGQFYNQLSDFTVDKQAGLSNTAMLVGERNTRYLMGLSGLLTVVCIGIAIWQGVFPAWLVWVLLSAVVIVSMFDWQQDMRGNPSDASGTVQQPILLIANIVAFVWLIVALGLVPTS
ncbi:MAG: prenyltransferase [Chloroflexota bacterium]